MEDATEKYNGHTKEARRAGNEKLVNTKMEPWQDPHDCFFILDKCRGLFQEMGQTVHVGTRIIFYVLSPLKMRDYY